MSDSRSTGSPPPSSGWRGCGIALLIILGVLLLLPGMCSLFFMSAGMTNGAAAFGLLISFAGLVLILYAVYLAMKRPPS